MNPWEDKKRRQINRVTVDFVAANESLRSSNEPLGVVLCKQFAALMEYEKTINAIRHTPQYYDACAKTVSVNDSGVKHE